MAAHFADIQRQIRDQTEQQVHAVGDLNNWLSDMHSRDKEIRRRRGGYKPTFDSAAPIREQSAADSVSQKKSTDKPAPSKSAAASAETSASKRSVKPREYREWDKFDVDGALEKMEIEEKKREEKEMEEKVKERARKRAEENASLRSEQLQNETPSQRADRYKAEGNTFFRQKDFQSAIEKYSLGLKADPTAAVLYSNRAQCYYNLGEWQSVINDTTQCLEHSPQTSKALFRRAQALRKVGREREALDDLRSALCCEWMKKSGDSVDFDSISPTQWKSLNAVMWNEYQSVEREISGSGKTVENAPVPEKPKRRIPIQVVSDSESDSDEEEDEEREREKERKKEVEVQEAAKPAQQKRRIIVEVEDEEEEEEEAEEEEEYEIVETPGYSSGNIVEISPPKSTKSAQTSTKRADKPADATQKPVKPVDKPSRSAGQATPSGDKKDTDSAQKKPVEVVDVDTLVLVEPLRTLYDLEKWFLSLPSSVDATMRDLLLAAALRKTAAANSLSLSLSLPRLYRGSLTAEWLTRTANAAYTLASCNNSTTQSSVSATPSTGNTAPSTNSWNNIHPGSWEATKESIELLHGLTKCERFGLTVMFLDGGDRKRIQSAVGVLQRAVEGRERESAGDAEIAEWVKRVEEIRKAYQ